MNNTVKITLTNIGAILYIPPQYYTQARIEAITVALKRWLENQSATSVFVSDYPIEFEDLRYGETIQGVLMETEYCASCANALSGVAFGNVTDGFKHVECNHDKQE